MKTKGSMSPSSARRILGCAIASLAAGMLLQSCATPQGGDQTFSMHPAVSINVVQSGAGCPATWTCWTSGQWTIQISEEPINTANDASPVEIHWVLIANGWTYDRKGIDFKGRGTWREDPVTSTEWKATSRKDGVIYKYAINLKGPSSATLSWDPTVMN